LQPADAPDGAAQIALDSLKAGDKFYFEVQSNAAWSAVSAADQTAIRHAQLAYGQPSLLSQTFRAGATNGAAAISIGGKAACSTDLLSECERNADGVAPGLSELPVGTVLLCPLVDNVESGGDKLVRGFVLLQLVENDGNYGHVLYATRILKAVIPVGYNQGKDFAAYAAWENNNGPLPNHLLQ
jgi:hypothetical protein